MKIAHKYILSLAPVAGLWELSCRWQISFLTRVFLTFPPGSCRRRWRSRGHGSPEKQRRLSRTPPCPPWSSHNPPGKYSLIEYSRIGVKIGGITFSALLQGFMQSQELRNDQNGPFIRWVPLGKNCSPNILKWWKTKFSNRSLQSFIWLTCQSHRKIFMEGVLLSHLCGRLKLTVSVLLRLVAVANIVF